jgi:hypothetical protein
MVDCSLQVFVELEETFWAVENNTIPPTDGRNDCTLIDCTEDEGSTCLT